jgi:hypothetical protein
MSKINMEVWSKSLPDGGRVYINRASGPANNREYLVVIVKPNGHKLGACLVGENGIPKQWYDMPYDRTSVEEAIRELPETLLIERVHET